MSITTKLIRTIEHFSAKHFALAGLFVLALAGSITLGVLTRGITSASVQRDCDTNSIDYKDINGGCGAANATELVADARSNKPNDLQTVYAHFGLTTDKYDTFAKNAKSGVVNRDGTVVVDGQTVMNDAWTMGREKFNSHRKPITIGGVTYYYSAPEYSFASGVKSLPVMVLFDDNGVAQVVIMNACGNTVGGNKVTNSVSCKALNQTQPDAAHKPNTYNYTTSVGVAGNAKISRVVYHFSDTNTTITKTGPNAGDQVVPHTFAKDGTVTVTVYATVPGGKEIQAVAVANCKKSVQYVPPFYVCTNLIATPINDTKKAFRFTVHAKTDTTGQTVLKDVDFTLDSKDVTKGVTTKDDQGNVYKEYSFTDEVTHTVKASVNFNTAEGVQSVDCQASVTPAKTPKCTVPGHENEAPNSPNCGYCKPNIPIGDDRCKEQVLAVSTTKLADTGPGSTAGLIAAFTGVATAGFFGHNLFLRRRVNR